jgi:cell fate regulator YaaT (PSP1 superfamily)
VSEVGEKAHRKRAEKKNQLCRVKRLATEKEIQEVGRLSEKEGEAFDICVRKVSERGLEMKLVDSEWQFDGNKVTFYFTAEKRVDFRQLVKDLAAIFKTRIELKQIGVRDEARRIGGCGRCGYKLCCTSFLVEFEPVTLKAAKEQRLSLNPSQISGICGRLMCCLMYERDFYKDQVRRFPKEGKQYQTGDGCIERVSGLDLFNEQVELENRDGGKRRIGLDEFLKVAGECACDNNRQSRKKRDSGEDAQQ